MDGYLISSVIELPGCHTQAKTYDELLSRTKEAIELYQQSSDLLKSIDDKELRVYVLKCLSALQVRTGDQLQAMASMEAALQIQKKLTPKEKFLKKLLGIPFKSSR